jgi:hypothetical protein
MRKPTVTGQDPLPATEFFGFNAPITFIPPAGS